MDDAFSGGVSRGSRAQATQGLLEFIRSEFGVDKGGEPIDLGGSCGLNLLATAQNQPIVIKIHRPHVKLERLRTIGKAVSALRGKIPCPEPVLTLKGEESTEYDGRLVTAERYVKSDSRMKSHENLIAGLPLLARMHTIFAETGISLANPPFVNYVSAQSAHGAVTAGCNRILSWNALSDIEREIAETALSLAERLSITAQTLPCQLTHGDFWDNNVLFKGGSVALVTDFDFMGMRPRIDDLALTLYFFMSEPGARADGIALADKVKRLVSAYDSGLDRKLTLAERMALPLALARQPLWSIGVWGAMLMDENAARGHISDLLPYIKRAHDMLDGISFWQDSLVV